MKQTKRKSRKKPQDNCLVQDPQISSTIASDIEHSTNCVDNGADFAFLDERVESRLRLNYHKIKVGEKWYEMQFNDGPSAACTVTSELLSKFESFAGQLLEQEVICYENQKDNRKVSESSWLRNVSIGGTVGDKIAALIVRIHENPILNLAQTKTLVAQVDKSNRRESLMTAEAFRDLCSQNLLPDRKLVPFKLRPLADIKKLSGGNKATMEKRLILWLFEDKLKQLYEEFLRRLEKITHDTVEVNRIKAVGIMTDLIINKPEQEQFLLSSIVNKLGDPTAKVASKVVHFLGRLLENHGRMKAVVVNEVKNLVYRLHISPRAQYFGILCLTQIRVRKHMDIEVASQLIGAYFWLFKLLVEKNSLNNKMLALLLKGTNKAFPVAKDKKDVSILNDLNSLYKVVAIGSLGTALQALLLLLQVTEASEGVTDRFYSSLYRKLLDPSLESSTNYHPLLFHFLYKALKSDPVEGRTGAFLKRLLQIALYSAPPLACAILLLASELIYEKPALLRLSKHSQNIDFLKNDDADDGDEHFVDVHGAESETEADVAVKCEEQKSITPSWVHKKHLKSNSRNKFEYDPYNRNPMFANASASLLYELTLLRNHYHPSVALFAGKVLNNERIEYQGDPLQDFSLMRFLDRFSYRNPKKRANSDSSAGRIKKLPKRTSYAPWGVKKLAVTSQDYVKASADEVPIDEQFLHKYMKSFGNLKAEGDQEDGESINSDEFDDMLGAEQFRIPKSI